MAFGFKRIYNGLQIVAKTTSTVSVAGDIDFDTTANRLNLYNGTTASAFVTLTHAAQGASRLQNKDLDAASTKIVDGTDTTKKTGFQLSGATTATTTTLIFAQTANRSITFPDTTGTLALSADPASGYVLKTGDTMTGALTINTASNQLVLSSATNAVTINSGTSAAARTYTIPDMGTTADFVMTAGTQTIGGSKTFSSALNISPVSNQLVLGTTNTTTINAAAPAASRTYTIPDTLANSSFIMSDSAQTKNGALTLSNNLNLNRTDDTTTTGANQDLALPTKSFLKLTNAGLTSVRSIGAGADGQVLTLTNATTVTITINNEDGTATAANRILTGTGSNISIPNNSSIDLKYDTGSSRWRVIGSVSGGFVSNDASTRGSPTNVSAASTVTINTRSQSVIYVQGNAGHVTMTANPQLTTSGINEFSVLVIRGRNNDQTVTFVNSNGLSLNGPCTLAADDSLSLMFDGTNWVELSRSN